MRLDRSDLRDLIAVVRAELDTIDQLVNQYPHEADNAFKAVHKAFEVLANEHNRIFQANSKAEDAKTLRKEFGL